jgi:glucose/mannose-6-phosphate isomerase
LEVFSELDHNAIEGVLFPLKNNLFVIILESNFDSERLVRRVNITSRLLMDSRIGLERVKFLPCDSLLAEILIHVLFGDYVSYYMAILNNIDPSSIHNITHLKTDLLK